MKPQGTKTQSKNEAIEFTPRRNILCGLKNSFVWFLCHQNFWAFKLWNDICRDTNVTEY